METMDYNNFNNKKPGVGIIIFTLIILLGGSLVAYALINEPEPVIVGQDALVNIYQAPEVKADVNTKYKVNNMYKTESTGNFKAKIVLPKVILAGVELKDINIIMANKFIERYEMLKSENAKTLENTFTYKTTYKTYYNKFENGKEIISFVIFEKIIDDASGQNTMNNIYGYSIDITNKTVINQSEASALTLGSNYSNIIRNKVKSYVVNKKMISSDKYRYSVTGLEEFYIKDNRFHIILNKGTVVYEKYGNIDLKITE